MRLVLMMACCLAMALATLRALADEPMTRQAAAEMLRNANPQVRLTAVMHLCTLAQRGEHQAALAMAPALQDEEQYVRDAAHQAYDNLPHTALVQTVLAATRDTDAETRRCAILALTVLQGDQHQEYACVAPQLAALDDPDPSVREAAHWSLQQVHDDARIEIYLLGLHNVFGQGLRPKGLDGGYPRRQLLIGLGWPAEANPVPQVMAGLTSPNPYVRRWSAWLAGCMDQPAAIPPLQQMLTDANPLVRLGAAEGLGRIFDPAVVQPLVRALADADPTVRRQAILALGRARTYAVNYQMHCIDHYVDEQTISKAKALEAELARLRTDQLLQLFQREPDTAGRKREKQE